MFTINKQYFKSKNTISSKTFIKRIKNFIQNKYSKIEIINFRGESVLNDPFSNKTLAFPHDERDRLHLRGLLPPTVITMEMQSDLYMEEYNLTKPLIRDIYSKSR